MWKADANLLMRAGTTIEGFPSFPKDLCTFIPNLKYIYHNIFWHKLRIFLGTCWWQCTTTLFYTDLCTHYFLFTSLRMCSKNICESEQSHGLWLSSENGCIPKWLHALSPVMMKCRGAVMPSWVCDLTLAKYLTGASRLLPPAPHISRVPLCKLWMNLTLVWPRSSPESSQII